MRMIGGVTVVYLLMVAVQLTGSAPGRDDPHRDDGQEIFRYDTFGDEQLSRVRAFALVRAIERSHSAGTR